MLRKTITYCIFFLLINNYLFSQLLHQVVVKSDITENGKILKNVNLKVYEDGKLYSKQNLINGKFSQTLNVGKNYIFKISKPGYVQKKIEVSTKNVSTDELKYGLYPIEIPLSLFKTFPGVSYDILDKPITKIYYSDYEGDFIYDKDYYNKMKSKILDVKNKINDLRKKAYNKEIVKADKNFNTKKYEDAWIHYLQAEQYLPKEQYPVNQIEKIKDILAEISSFDKAYQRNIKKADKKLNDKKYNDAISYYQKALLYKPAESYPRNQINNILKLLAQSNENSTDNQIAQNTTTDNNYQNNTTTNNNNNITSNNNNNQEQSPVLFTDKSNKSDKTILDNNKNVDEEETYKKIKSLQVDAVKSDNLQQKAILLFNIGSEYYKIGKFDKAIDNLQKSLQISQEINDTSQVAATTENIALLYDNIYRYTKALEYYKKAINVNKKTKNQNKIARLYNRIADLKFQQGKYHESISYYKKSIIIDKKLGNKKEISSSYNSIGAVNYEMKKYNQALKYYKQSVKISKKLKNTKETAITYNNIGNVNYDKNKYKTALNYYKKSIDLKEKVNYQKGIAISLYNIGNVYLKQKKYKKAIEQFNKSRDIAEQINYKELKIKNYNALANLYNKQKNCSESLKYYKLLAAERIFMDNSSLSKQITELHSNFYRELNQNQKELNLLRNEIIKQKILSKLQEEKRENQIYLLNYDKKLKEIELQKKNQQVRNQQIIIFAGLLGLILILIFVYLLFRQIQQKRKANKLLAEQKQEITDSILYAKRIQTAVLPDKKILKKNFAENFIIYKPKDIVSGDFYWFAERSNKIIIIIADCTGHGVPGGFMSMLGISFINEIVQSQPGYNFNASEILNKLRKYIIESLHQTNNDNKDGLDLSLLIIDKKTENNQYACQFAGAHHSAIIVKHNTKEIKQIKGDRMPVSIYFDKENTPFTNHDFYLDKSDIIYMFTDGYTDQLGGDKNKTFKFKKLINIISENHDKPLTEQEKILLTELKNWQKEFPQTDDILFIGVKV